MYFSPDHFGAWILLVCAILPLDCLRCLSSHDTPPCFHCAFTPVRVHSAARVPLQVSSFEPALGPGSGTLHAHAHTHTPLASQSPWLHNDCCNVRPLGDQLAVVMCCWCMVLHRWHVHCGHSSHPGQSSHRGFPSLIFLQVAPKWCSAVLGLLTRETSR